MPALNEEANLEPAVLSVLSALNSLRIKGEIVLINDGSQDNTGKIADKLKVAHPNILVIHHKENQGIGFSFWEGSKQSRGDVVVMLPGDGENEPEEILRYLPLLSEVDIVIPFVYNKETRTFYRRTLSIIYKAIINLSFGMLLNYMNGTVMYRRSALLSLSLRSAGFFYQTELLIKAIRFGYLYAEVPYAIKSRPSGTSKAVSLYSLVKLSKDYLKALSSVYFETASTGKGFPSDTVTYQRKNHTETKSQRKVV